MLRLCWKEKQKENFHSISRYGFGRDRIGDRETFSRLFVPTITGLARVTIRPEMRGPLLIYIGPS